MTTLDNEDNDVVPAKAGTYTPRPGYFRALVVGFISKRKSVAMGPCVRRDDI
jgi:hypothetical protein